MPGSKKEVKNAREEGANFEFNVKPAALERNEHGNGCGVRFLPRDLCEQDHHGRAAPSTVGGREMCSRGQSWGVGGARLARVEVVAG
ncbi:oxidoreductase [Escherichia coli]|nr:oxidoreductase [Escherichia coli]